MDRKQILTEIKRFFDIDELVCNHTYKKWGSRAWRFLDTDYLHCLLVIRRDILKAPMYCNGKGATQRGLRCNCCAMVKGKASLYLSMHIFGKAGDFTVTGYTAEQARKEIERNAWKLPCPIRMESGVSWLHFDVMPNDDNANKVTYFSA